MSLYDYWIDGNGNVHKISEMNKNYILSCLAQIEKMGHSWRMCTVKDLSDIELKEITKVGTKAWYVVNAEKYVDSFEIELAVREATE